MNSIKTYILYPKFVNKTIVLVLQLTDFNWHKFHVNKIWHDIVMKSDKQLCYLTKTKENSDLYMAKVNAVTLIMHFSKEIKISETEGET